MLPPELWRLYASLLAVLLLYPSFSLQAATLERRILTPLSDADVSLLVSARDPLRNLDPSNADSHLSKILIPRPRMVLNLCKLFTNLSTFPSGHRKQYPSSELYHLHIGGS